MLWFVVNRNLLQLLKLQDEKEKKKLEAIESYLSDASNIDTECKEVFVDIRTSRYFKSATGIYAENKQRDALIALHNSLSSDISWTTIRRANPHIDFDSQNKAKVSEPTTSQKLGKFYNNMIGWLFLFFAALVFLIMIATAETGIIQFLLGMGMMVGCVGISLFSFAQNFPLASAERIRKELLLGSEKPYLPAPDNEKVAE